ncbi:MAG: ATP-dependent DNA helicase, partial [Streptosporangiaceae bacterium]
APAPDGVTQTGLRLDQAAAAYLALTSPRRAELIVGPAGTGKTYTAVRIAAAWRAAGRGKVIGITTTSAGRNVLTQAGIETAENTAQFLGHLPGQREARGATSLGPDALILLDEASTTSMPDLAAVLRHARVSGAKVVITGDHAQLGAVTGGGGMAMLARRMGHAQLTDAVRFRQAWEGPASLAIRAGDVSALATYDQHGRLHGGSYEGMAEQAARAYLAEYLAGRDVALTAFGHRECADLSRRVQDYLLAWDQLEPGATVALREDARAYAGDLIIARQNDNHLVAGDPGHTLANGDLLRIQAITDGGLTVARLIRPDHPGGQRTWTAPFTITKEYAAAYCDLGYAQTWHTVEGQTVDVGIAVASDARSREGLYVGMTRGALRNDVYAYPAALEPGQDPAGQGPVADPEITRQHALEAERAGAVSPGPAGAKDPVSLLAPVVRRSGGEMSAAETRDQALSGADHLGVLHAIWTDQCRAAAHARYTAAVRAAASPADADQILADTNRLWRAV